MSVLYFFPLTPLALLILQAIPYDYRMSQMIHEGRDGEEPSFPFPWIRRKNGSQFKLSPKKNKFSRWMKTYDKDDPIKESSVIANFAESNYLESHIEGQPALVHGVNVYKPLNPHTHEISLVVSSWNQFDLTRYKKVLQDLVQTWHQQPFKEVILLEENVDAWDIKDEIDLPAAGGGVMPYQILKRISAATVDICNAPVKTEWFFYTNGFHRPVDEIDLLFTNDHPISRPLIPYTPAESLHCTDYTACTETLRLAREIYPSMDKVVLDMNIPYHTVSRNSFCTFWKNTYGEEGQLLYERELASYGRRLTKDTPLAPTATAYIAYLYKTGIAENIYSFTNVLRHGSRPVFTRVGDEATSSQSLQGRRKLQGVSTRNLSSKICVGGPSDGTECTNNKDCKRGGKCNASPTTAPSPAPTAPCYDGTSVIECRRRLSISYPGILVED